jgi:hypothetical protein
MVGIMEVISEMAADDVTMCRNTKQFVFGPFTIFVRPLSKYRRLIIQFCNQHQAFLNSRPNLQDVDDILFQNSFESYTFAALGLAYGLFSVSETESEKAIPLFTINGYVIRSED